jgi:predicted house-cleaning noncanonical NTP pyrophosphatase (MazG superfamily)
MDIRLAQQIALGNTGPKGLNTTDAPSGFRLLSKEVAEVFGAWYEGRGTVSEELAAVAFFLIALAEMAGPDLQEAVEARLAVGDATECWPLSTGVAASDPSAAARAARRHGKLVRDKIPQIIRSKGDEPVIHTASLEEYDTRLRDKLKEEVDEFLASDNDPEELADILEVLHALAVQAGIDRQQLEKLRADKAEKRGGFADRIIWSGNRAAAAALDVTALASGPTASAGLQRRPPQRKPATAG